MILTIWPARKAGLFCIFTEANAKVFQRPPPNLLPQASRCKSPQDCLLTAREGAKMSLPHKRHIAFKYS